MSIVEGAFLVAFCLAVHITMPYQLLRHRLQTYITMYTKSNIKY